MRWRAIAPTLGAVTVSFLVPIAASIALSWRLAVRDQELRAEIIAAEVLHRTHAISTQIARARSALQGSSQSKSPCSSASIALMRQLAISASYLQLVGHVEDDRLVCSSFGDHGEGISLGPPDYRSSRGAWIRRAVKLPFSAESEFFIVTEADGGTSSLALPDLILDAGREASDVAIALVAVSGRQVIFERGEIDAQNLPPFHQGTGQLTWKDGGQIGVIKFSATNDYAAVAVSAPKAFRQAWRNTASWLIPFGVLIGAVLSSMTLLMFRQRRGMPAQLDRALRGNELFLAYMPIVELSGGKWVGAEALLRWRRPNGEMIGPDKFIPVAEQTNRIRKLTAKMLQLLSEDTQELLRHPGSEFYVSVNLSAADLADPAIVEQLRQAQVSGITMLMVEATEGVFLDVNRVRNNICLLRDLGIQVAIDDFGTGYSSLGYLGSLQVDCLNDWNRCSHELCCRPHHRSGQGPRSLRDCRRGGNPGAGRLPSSPGRSIRTGLVVRQAHVGKAVRNPRDRAQQCRSLLPNKEILKWPMQVSPRSVLDVAESDFERSSRLHTLL